ncbi:hypothetical protein REPUB_Repub17cG0014400 [Reevesia pubescens]
MAKMLSPALCILLLAIVLLNFASTSMPQTTNSDPQQQPLSGFQLAASSQVPIMVSRNSSNQLPLAESSQLLSSESEKEKKEEKEKKKEKERKKEEKEKKRKEDKKKRRKKEEDCSVATTSVKQSNIGVFCMLSLALLFFDF